MKWTSAVVLAASLAGVNAKIASKDLVKDAVKATIGIPFLKEKERKRRLAFKTKMENLVQSKDRKLQNNNGGYYGNYNYQGQGNNNGNNGGDNGANNYNANNYNNGQGQDYYNGYWYGNDYNYQWNQDMAEEEFGFDITAYAIKYTGCHTVETYNPTLAENDQFETVLGTQRYATFRLCPVEYCNTNNRWGCDQNYGEYVVPLDNYVQSIVEYGQQRVEAYCEFCEDCAAREAYRSWSRSQINQMEYDMQLAEELYEQFRQNMQRQNAYDQANAQGGGYYMQDQDYYQDDESDATYMMAYYKRISNMQQGGNNNGYNANNQGNGGYSNYNQYMQGANNPQNYNFYNQQMWKFSNNQNYQNNPNYQQEQAQEQVNQDYWSNMGQFATFNGHSIYPGYFSNQGEFIQGWGYFYQGEWVSMEDQEVIWDENLYGEVPEAWENYIGENPDELEQCEYDYSSGCYQNYDQCMMYLKKDNGQDDWYPDWYQQDYDQENANNNANYKANMNYQYYVEQQQQKEENQYLAMTGEMFACHQVIYNPDWDGDYNENYQNQQYNNAQMYQLNKYMEYKLELCGNDEACIYDIEQQMQQNQEFMEWLAEYNEQLYDQWINGEKLYYIGASCDEDGGIKLSVYNDDDCSYEDSSVSAEKILGFDITDYMNYDLIPDQCIPCDDQLFMQDQYYFGEEQNEDGQEEGVTPMCSMLYQISGKCNENLKPENLFTGYYQDGEYVEVNYAQMYQSFSQQQNEDLACSFIESLNSGTYDQTGQVYLDNSKWGAPSKWQQGIAEASRNMPGGLKAALFLTALAAALMGVWACMLHGALARKNIPWQPKRNAAAGGVDPVDMARQNSGIVMGRSRSGPVTHPLI